MIDTMIVDSNRIIKRIETLRDKLHQETEIYNPASNDVIRTIAVSNEISNEMKEVLILLQTTMATEATESKLSSFSINLEVIDTAREVIKLQNSVISKLYELEKPNIPKPNKLSWDYIFKNYKGVISIGAIFLLLWGLMIADSETTTKVIDGLPKIVKGVLR